MNVHAMKICYAFAQRKNPKFEIHFHQIDINSVMVSFFGPLKNPN